jgi:HD-GYP domain-containing protein (c-di-GMP phosphodiesterase class II)
VLHPHERDDGMGDPSGLEGEEIPLLARILAVADAFSAMMTDRPYRKALTLNEARDELLRNAGKQFDPQLAQEFIALLDNGQIG